MAKPFKSEFDLMAEAYGEVDYKKQSIINEDTAAKTVRGYPAEVSAEEDAEGEHKAEEELKPVGSGKKSYEHLGYGKAEDGE